MFKQLIIHVSGYAYNTPDTSLETGHDETDNRLSRGLAGFGSRTIACVDQCASAKNLQYMVATPKMGSNRHIGEASSPKS